MGSIPGSVRSPDVGNGNPLQYSCLENSMDRGAWQTTVHRAAKSRLKTHMGTICKMAYWCLCNCKLVKGFSLQVCFFLISASKDMRPFLQSILWVRELLACCCCSFFFFLIEVYLIYNVVPISAIQHSESVIHIYAFSFLRKDLVLFFLPLSFPSDPFFSPYFSPSTHPPTHLSR